MVLTIPQVAGILIFILGLTYVSVILFLKRRNKKEKRRLEAERSQKRAIWLSMLICARDSTLAKLRKKAAEYEDVPGGQTEWSAIQEEIKDIFVEKNELEAELRELEMLLG